jgi:hypothetical protein
MASKALAFNCSLKSAKAEDESSTEALLGQMAKQLRHLDVGTEIVRAVDHDISPEPITTWGRGTPGRHYVRRCWLPTSSL